jgi:methylated-DNA-[protein]-cysteine S-methyltransferase
MPTTFQEKVYALLRQVPAGQVTTYRELAKALHSKAYRAVGRALRDNPYAPVVPCHRVVYSDGFIGGYKGVLQGTPILEKIAWLKQEGVLVKNNRVIRFKELLYRFPVPA